MVESSVEELSRIVDDAYLLTMASMIFVNQIGFLMLEVGLVRKKNTRTILIKNFLDTCVTAIAFWIMGFAIAYGTEAGKESVAGGAGGKGFTAYHWIRMGGNVKWFLAFAFAATCVSIVSGAVAERCHMTAYFVAAAVLAGIVHPVCVNWVWSDAGWLSMLNANGAGSSTAAVGMLDFAGAGVVHLCGGVSALVGAIIVGPRDGRFVDKKNDDYNLEHIISDSTSCNTESAAGSVSGVKLEIDCRPSALVVMPMAQSSPSIQGIGVFFLWFGWYGFNMGSVGSITAPGAIEIAAICAVNTTLSAASAAISSTAIAYHLTGEGYSVEATLNGSLAGLVAICAGCATVTHLSAVFIGIFSAVVYQMASKLMLKYGIDDVVDAVAIHGACGMWGCIACAILSVGDKVEAMYGITGASANGLLYGGDGQMLTMALAGVSAIILFTGFSMYLVFATMAYFGCLRVGDLRERNGLDTTYHGDSETPTIPITRQLATATLLERLQRLQTATKSIDKAHLVALGVDCGADLDYLISRFEVYSGGLLIISGSDMKAFVLSIHNDMVGLTGGAMSDPTIRRTDAVDPNYEL